MKINRLMPPLLLFALIGGSGQMVAADFTTYSNDDLFQMRDQTRYMDSKDRDAYQNERQSRMQSLSYDERMNMRSGDSSQQRSMSGAENGKGSMKRTRKRDGSGGGQGNKYGQGGGGQGNRYGQGGGGNRHH